jgi:hypothetical protein
MADLVAIHPGPSTEFDEEGGCGLEVVDDDSDVFHPLKRQVPSIRVGSLGTSSGEIASRSVERFEPAAPVASVCAVDG